MRGLSSPSASQSATVSLAASSGRHKIAMSTEARMSRFAAASLRVSGGSETSEMSARPESRSRISSPVVPASPSMKIFVFVVMARI